MSLGTKLIRGDRCRRHSLSELMKWQKKIPFHSINFINYKFEGTDITTTRLETGHSTTEGNKRRKKGNLRSIITLLLASFYINKRMRNELN
jgi:hypothetical protein